jgi:hypothetical protein
VIGLPSLQKLDGAPGPRIWLAAEATDMRCGFDRLAQRVQAVIGADPLSGHLFLFRSRSGKVPMDVLRNGLTRDHSFRWVRPVWAVASRSGVLRGSLLVLGEEPAYRWRVSCDIFSQREVNGGHPLEDGRRR